MTDIAIDRSYSSPNCNDRKNGGTIDMVVLHYTGMRTAQDAIDRLCSPAAEVSAHYIVNEDGLIYQIVPDRMRAWHAGVSYWQGVTDINSHSIGVEIVNTGHEFGYQPFPQAQMASVTQLCQHLKQAYDIPASGFIGHSDVAPERKIDPGELFPWQDLARQGIGIWPSQRAVSVRGYEDILTMGYDPKAPQDVVWEAFHRHFYPQRLGQEPDGESLRRASVLADLFGKK